MKFYFKQPEYFFIALTQVIMLILYIAFDF